jgi:hypothetical protein
VDGRQHRRGSGGMAKAVRRNKTGDFQRMGHSCPCSSS